jgi:riboflavin synthase
VQRDPPAPTLDPMFTGIVEKTVRVVGVAEGPKFNRLTLAVDWEDVRDGESVAVNGACLTVAERKRGEIGFDVVRETLLRTNLGLLAGGDEVHVERSLRAGDRIDGHFVQGHVDGTARLVSLTDEKEWRLTAECPQPLVKYVIPKGSVALDGVSLTIAAVRGNLFEVALIPTTLRLTTLGRRPSGWPLNLECDILAKTVVTALERLKG